MRPSELHKTLLVIVLLGILGVSMAIDTRLSVLTFNLWYLGDTNMN